MRQKKLYNTNLVLQSDLLISLFEVTWACKRSLRHSKEVTLKKLGVYSIENSANHLEHDRHTIRALSTSNPYDRHRCDNVRLQTISNQSLHVLASFSQDVLVPVSVASDLD